MFAILRTRTVAAMLAVLGAGLAAAPGQQQSAKDFQADEAVKTISVKIQVGADGADLDEPLALDLGCGFPFWLYPVGMPDKAAASFGAVPQAHDAGPKVAAGSSVRFTFAAEGDEGQDTMMTSPQLLAGLRVGDIARVGFAGRGERDWILAGYELEINEKRFTGQPSLNLFGFGHDPLDHFLHRRLVMDEARHLANGQDAPLQGAFLSSNTDGLEGIRHEGELPRVFPAGGQDAGE